MKRAFSRIVLLFLAAALLCPAALAVGDGFDNFTPADAYDGQFTDVPADAWYAQSVADAYALGLMTGSGDGVFAPDSDISLAETIVLACRLRAVYLGEEADFSGGSPWYQPYVDYAQENGLIRPGAFSDYSAAATRAEFAQILAALPEEMLAEVNEVEAGAIPDVDMAAPYAHSVYRLYRAGIAAGGDDIGTYHPDSPIARREVAAIVTRIALPDQRRSFELRERLVTLYADCGCTVTVGSSEASALLALGWRTEPFSVDPSAGIEAALNAATLQPLSTGDQELDQMADAVLAQIVTEDMTTYQKVKACYDYLIENTSYQQSITFLSPYHPYVSDWDYLITLWAKQALSTGTGVCNDYASAFLVLTRRIGLQTYLVEGLTSKAGGGWTGHAWNVISVGGTDYVFDAQVEDNIAKGGAIQYYRFGKTYDQVSQNYSGYDSEADKAAFWSFETR